VIRATAHKYSISALYRCLGITRSTYYYECTGRSDERDLEEAIQIAYDENRRVYGQRKLKRVLLRKGWIISRANEAPYANLLDREYNNRLPGACVVSDLTYIRVSVQWAYIFILLDLGAGEIIGYSAGTHKIADLVHDTFASVKGNLFEIQIFHTERDSEFDNILIDEFLESFQIRCSLSMKGCPYDNTVAESPFKMITAEFIASRQFDTLV
jgi:putative transposase